MNSILIADGNENVAKLFATVLAHHDWKATPFSDPRRIVEALRSGERYDVVIVSYEVNGASGIELIELVRGLEHRKHTPVVMVTGGTVSDEAIAAGANEVLRKPIDNQALVAAVSKYISGAKSDEQ